MKSILRPSLSVALLLCATILSAQEVSVTIRTDVPNKAFYKDLLMDTGIEMSDYRTMPVTDYLNLSTETLFCPETTAENMEIQKRFFCGSPEDLNGILLYPDGAPRYRMVYVNGGLASYHGRSLTATGRDRFRQFVEEGGSYVGSCAGAFVACDGLVENGGYTNNGYLGLWPGLANNTDVYDIYPTYILPETSPLLRYYDFGGDRRVDSMKHWNGPYFEFYDAVPGTEVLAINDYPAYKYHLLPSVIAYKASAATGRVIPCGGHPEQYKEGERRDFMAALVKYALDGIGYARVKAVLRNGDTRIMDKYSNEDDPAHARIGDRQCHHFVFGLPEGARDIRIRLEAGEEFNLSLRLVEGTFAFMEDAQYAVENGESVKELRFDTLEAGTWYIGVQCEDAVSNFYGNHGINYVGRTAVLNGAPYKISVSWKSGFSAGQKAVLRTGSDFNEIIKGLASPGFTPGVRKISRDSLIRRIVFRANDPSAAGTLVSERGSAPIYASWDEATATITVSSPAAEIYTNRTASFMFCYLNALEEVDGTDCLNASGTVYYDSIFEADSTATKMPEIPDIFKGR
ncbi:MAG: hypothetical protein IKX45_03780 [Bacteroidales bacterium]|nr:hypothetical protein [Bacteroidales bacterium]MBR5703352.1 hypothetical protein [Bacteroidales bacterium]